MTHRSAITGAVGAAEGTRGGQPIPTRRLLDNRSAPCAVGLIKAAQTMQALQSGDELEIWSRDRFAPMEIPLFAQREGYGVEQQPSVGRWPKNYFVFVVTKL